MTTFRKIVLYTDRDGRAKWREEEIALTEGTPQAMLSQVLPASGCQLRHSPVGFRSQWHCTPKPQWVFILAGEMEIGLQDGSSRVFKPGQHFFSTDVLPEGAAFDEKLHGHWSAQRGATPLETLFVKG
ncbi:MAG: hypothetical protein M3544_14005 [Pseudomonadota bacterium]|nr:hypothetical protein [Pseudomonadota bacterium]